MFISLFQKIDDYAFLLLLNVDIHIFRMGMSFVKIQFICFDATKLNDSLMVFIYLLRINASQKELHKKKQKSQFQNRTLGNMEAKKG